MADKKVFISTSTFAQNNEMPLKALEKAGFDVVLNPYKRKLTKQEALDLYSNFDGLIAGLETLDAEVLSKSRLKVIVRCGAGMSNVDQVAAQRLKIKVLSTPDAPTLAVAELTIGAMLSLLRSLSQMNQQLHAGQWQKIMGSQLMGKTIVIVGFGRIGRKVAELLNVFKVKIVVVDPLLTGSRDLVSLSLDQALPQADIITFHVSGQEELIGAKEFQLMKDGVILLNASRGEVINEGALVNALKSHKVAGAWCDVFSQEPYQGPLCAFPQVMLTPHIGSYTEECRQLMEMQAVDGLINAFK